MLYVKQTRSSLDSTVDGSSTTVEVGTSKKRTRAKPKHDYHKELRDKNYTAYRNAIQITEVLLINNHDIIGKLDIVESSKFFASIEETIIKAILYGMERNENNR